MVVVGPLGRKGFMRGRILANRDLGPGVVTGTWGVLETTSGVLTGFRDKEGAGLVGNGGAGRRGRVADGVASGVEDRGAPGRRKLEFKRPVPVSRASPVALAICPLM